jgi:acetylornithine aminotransferase/acetylornithine/N-succinyldiaminopimelate aminotransferase
MMDEISHQEFMALDKQYVVQTYKRLPVTLVRGEGTNVWDANDKEYLDFLGGIAVVSLGHCHPEVVAAIERQARTLMLASNFFYTEPQTKLAQLLCEASGMDRAFFCNSGAEAVEGCVKLARKWGKEKREGAYEIIVAEGAFHGRTITAVTAGGTEKYRAPFTPLVEGFVRVPFDDIDAIKQATTGKTVAVMIEPIQGEAGVVVPGDDYLPAVRRWCDEAGILMILDEVQSGMGRTGKMFAYQHYGVEPDVIAVAKGLGSGFPIGAFLTKEHCASLGFGEHGTTFGGSPLACEVGYTVTKYMLDHDLPAEVARKGEYMERKLQSLADRHDVVTEVRGKGLFWAIELDRPASEEIVAQCLESGLILNNVRPTALRMVPPLTVSEEEIDRAMEMLDKVLSGLDSTAPK